MAHIVRYGRVWKFGSDAAVTSVAHTITMPVPAGLNADWTPPIIVRLKAPASNSDTIFISAYGVATTSDQPLQPGDVFEFSANSSFLSAIAATGTQTLWVTAFYA